MINTYQTSLSAPPIPPRLGRHQAATAPAPNLTPIFTLKSGPSKPVFRFLIGVVVLHLVLSFGGFIYLYHNGNKGSPAPGKVEFLSGKVSFSGTMARMIVQTPNGTPTSKYLPWNAQHSKMKSVGHTKDRLIVTQTGDYFVFSRVTFSKMNPKHVLASFVKVLDEDKREQTLMMAYCSLASSPDMCTASQAEVVSLKMGDQLGVWVNDPTLVDYTEGATTFGLYKL